jgi:hypothetical protein
MKSLKEIVQSHFSVLFMDKATGSPIARTPVYGEIAISSTKIPRIDNELVPLHIEPNDPRLALFYDVLSREVDEESLRKIKKRQRDVLLPRLSELLANLDNTELSDVDSRKAIKEIILKALTEAEIEYAPPVIEQIKQAHPLGYVATDHIGYASFDLRNFQRSTMLDDSKFIDDNEYAFYVYPLGKQEWRLEALEQARITKDAVFAKFAIEQPAFINDIKSLNLPSMQNPGLVDWYFSPGSFATKPGFLIGEDDCETLMPAQLALHQFNFQQVVRVGKDKPMDWPAGAPNLPPDAKYAYVDEYQASWYALGHSLGEIQYSLPLAPGESVKLAVIDWSWDNLTSRDEKTKFTEEVLHRTHRDRTISETVNAVVDEWQRGGNIQAGIAGGSGAAGSAGGKGFSSGNAWSLGGGYSTSSGSRKLAADNVQKLSDSFVQASSAQRELNSTVVIQARQEEKESIQTRTFTNYNHSHTLTILYYEVLRHFKLEVEWKRRRPAVLVAKPPARLPLATGKILVDLRYLLEPYLLDKTLNGAFEATARWFLADARFKRAYKKWSAGAQKNDPGMKVFTKLIANFTTTDDDSEEPVFVGLHLKDGQYFEFQFDGAADEGTSAYFEKDLPSPIFWKDINGIEVKLKDINSGSDWTETNIIIIMVTSSGEKVTILADNRTRTLDDEDGTTGLMTTTRPPPVTTTNSAPAPVFDDFASVEDEKAMGALIEHVNSNLTHYNRVLRLATDPNVIAAQFETEKWDATTFYVDHVAPIPLDTFGNFTAYPLLSGENVQLTIDDEKLERKAERLTTLPTRGVFAEGKLGHCNISEEIDETRFWRWDEHPIPVQAPDIAPIEAVTPQPQTTNIEPGAFPAALLSIVNPTPAPDPHGLGDALKVMAASNIFRDMSGRTETADLLKKLSDNSVRFAEIAEKAFEANLKPSATSSSPTAGGTAPATSGTGGGAQSAGAANPDNRQADAQATHAEAEAQKAKAEAAIQQAKAAKNYPKPIRDKIYQDGGQKLIAPTKPRRITFVFFFDTHDVMTGMWEIKLTSGGAILTSKMLIDSIKGVSGVNMGDRAEIVIPDQFGGSDDVTVNIKGIIVGTPKVFSSNSVDFRIDPSTFERNAIATVRRSDFDKSQTFNVVQTTIDAKFIVKMIKTDTDLTTNSSTQTAGLTLGTESQVEMGVEGMKGSVKVKADGTLSNQWQILRSTTSADGKERTVEFAGKMVSPATLDIKPLL